MCKILRISCTCDGRLHCACRCHAGIKDLETGTGIHNRVFNTPETNTYTKHWDVPNQKSEGKPRRTIRDETRNTQCTKHAAQKLKQHNGTHTTNGHGNNTRQGQWGPESSYIIYYTNQGKWEPGVHNQIRQSGFDDNESSSVKPRRPVTSTSGTAEQNEQQDP